MALDFSRNKILGKFSENKVVVQILTTRQVHGFSLNNGIN